MMQMNGSGLVSVEHMVTIMLAFLHQLKVRQPVVGSVLVNVVDDAPLGDGAVMLFPHETMFKAPAARSGFHPDVTSLEVLGADRRPVRVSLICHSCADLSARIKGMTEARKRAGLALMGETHPVARFRRRLLAIVGIEFALLGGSNFGTRLGRANVLSARTTLLTSLHESIVSVAKVSLQSVMT